MKKRILATSIICLSVLFNLTPSTAYAKQTIYDDICVTSVTRSSKTEWRYKFVNGLMYRRLYDLDNDCWIGDWELCP